MTNASFTNELRLYRKAFSQKELIFAEVSHLAWLATKTFTASLSVTAILFVACIHSFDGWDAIGSMDWSSADGTIIRRLFLAFWVPIAIFSLVLFSSLSGPSPIARWLSGAKTGVNNKCV